ncbi:hypothetical protein [Mycoplasmopsis verecunda]|uniref:Uncharacterized protein n=1 Tax=Mycoplasmopsis verecunda TaxID=171291 RepID=A0A1T4L0M3_9BACT|nr:hypothetical protein [Mycoplasmopsis verecunda]WPB54409.1 hypothetical protein SAM46_02880 [Mycoplasmopsis verecunda]SJZ48080.1 hypothetical protein SAMN02745154_00266 [Mycoplasmopsis verecunda]
MIIHSDNVNNIKDFEYSKELNIFLLQLVDIFNNDNYSFKNSGQNEKLHQLYEDLYKSFNIDDVKKNLPYNILNHKTKAINGRDKSFLRKLIYYIEDALWYIERGRFDMLIMYNKNFPESQGYPNDIALSFQLIWGLFRVLKPIITFRPTPDYVAETILGSYGVYKGIKSINNTINTLKEKHKQKFDITSDMVKELASSIRKLIPYLKEKIEDVLKHNKLSIQDIEYQNEFFLLLRSQLMTLSTIIKNLPNNPFTFENMLDRYAKFLDILIDANEAKKPLDYDTEIEPSSKMTRWDKENHTAWYYNPIVGDYYDPY